MSKIRAKGNYTTEIKMVELLRKNKIKGWRRHQKVFGNPDFIFKENKVAVFIDGCFWHGCPKCYVSPQSNKDYWSNKISNNRIRDRRITKELMRQGWRVIRIWEHSMQRSYLIIRKLKTILSESSNF